MTTLTRSSKYNGARKLLLAMVMGLTCAIGPAAAAPADPAPASLYTRLGGYDAIAAVVEDLVQRLAADPELGRFWAHRGADGIQREKQLVVNFIANRAGGPLHYAGRELLPSHVGMRISEKDWQSFMTYLNATLAKFKVPAKEKADVIAFMESTKADMVGR
jgi:hemoglobin